MPGDGRTPVVADDHSLGSTECVEEANHIADQMEQCVPVDGLRAVGFAVAAHVWSDSVETGFGEGTELVAPGVPRFREAVA